MSKDFYPDTESVEQYVEMAKGHDGCGLIKEFHAFLSDGASVLELGTGPGTDWRILSQRYQVTGSDFSIAFLKRLHRVFPEGQFAELDAATLSIDQQFDAIYSNKVLHHLIDGELISSIARQIQVLQPTGIICHSFWQGEGSEDYNGMHVNYHTREELRDFFSQSFDLLLMKTYAEFEPGDSVLVIGRKRSACDESISDPEN